ncbi:MAG: DUF1295 domain-containing protein [Oscillospiraceae bacterium]|nr:DUF1295 domain-containing protein [Oscillospiraceae bacterium]
MGWNYLGIFYLISLAVCSVGFIKYVYFLSIGYGFAVSAIGAALAVMSAIGTFEASLAHYVLFALMIGYGFRLSGFLLIRELKNAAYRKTLAEATGDEAAMPMFVKVTIWLVTSALYVAQTSPVYFRMLNGGEVSALTWAGIAICVLAIVIESVADLQKSAQKAVNPNKVATEGLYKIVRCPNYFGEILFWTGLTVSALDILSGFGQWLTAILAYVAIVYIMFNGAQRLERRQMARYKDDAEYKAYADSTPFIIPLLPIYHLNKQD